MDTSTVLRAPIKSGGEYPRQRQRQQQATKRREREMWECWSWWGFLLLWAAMAAAWLGCRDEWPAPLSLPHPAAAPSMDTFLMTDGGVGGRVVRRLGEGSLPQPEDVVAAPDGFLYVGCADGWIKRLHPVSGAVVPWVHIPGGRPLGLALGRSPAAPFHLIVADPYTGLLNVTQGSVELLTDEAACLKFKLTDAAVISQEGLIYFTDATHRYSFDDYERDFIEARPYGRLLVYDPATRATTVLMDGLYFANGVALSRNEDFLVVCETPLARCQRYWLKGEKAGSAEVFVENLPAFPDNIKNDGKGHFWVGLVSTRSFLLNELYKYPMVKGLLWRLTPKTLTGLLHRKAMVLCMTEEGRPLFNIADPTGGAIHFVTTALHVGGDLYLGNLGNDFLGHIHLADIPRMATYFQELH